ncbi:MAG TPA: tyrosine recombinase XerC [Clostridia bacterium]|jgi:integrase/recombinase XerD|nr:tyrosine recombinase XerC [Clostridiaceae bacterium]HOF25904.1 tyrosine recombinase XerC [Clostridia bacterium]HOM33653.1 tyrosine recombinase XerC [Clostridia bacterium]HOR88929.1 tyrosine recombinase XerC [Clostridia bacterium]HOT71272.1 tyrosine recombinase XerC [Clostridia bacterium]
MLKYEDLPDYCRDFLSYLETIQNRSPQTVNEYYYDIRMFLRFVKILKFNAKEEFDEITVKDMDVSVLEKLTLSDFYAYMTFLSRNRGASSKTRARKVASLRSFYKYLFSKVKLINNNPALELETPKHKKGLPRYLNLEESTKLLDNVESRHEKRDFAMLTLLLNCGIRISELVGINITDYRDDTIKISGKGNKERTIYLNDACRNAINEYMAVRPNDKAVDKNAMFLSERYTRISRKTVHVIVKKQLANAGIDTTKYSAHKLRHTAATLMYKHGDVDIRALQRILGHESIATTEIYTHLDDEQLRSATKKNPLADYKKEK